MATKNEIADKETQTIGYDAVIDELQTIKKLLMVLLAKLGSDSTELGDAIKVSPSTLRNWISFNGIERAIEKPDKQESKRNKRRPKAAGIPGPKVDTGTIAPPPEATPASKN